MKLLDKDLSWQRLKNASFISSCMPGFVSWVSFALSLDVLSVPTFPCRRNPGRVKSPCPLWIHSSGTAFPQGAAFTHLSIQEPGGWHPAHGSSLTNWDPFFSELQSSECAWPGNAQHDWDCSEKVSHSSVTHCLYSDSLQDPPFLFFFFFPWSPSRYKSSTYGSLSKLFPEKEFHPLLRAGLDMQHPEIKMVWLTGWKGMGANSPLLCWACSSSATATTVSQGCRIPEFHPRQIMRNSNFLICTCNSFWKCPATGATEKVQDHIFNNLPWSTVSWAAVKIASLVMGPTNAFAHLLSCIFAGLHT